MADEKEKVMEEGQETKKTQTPLKKDKLPEKELEKVSGGGDFNLTNRFS